MYDCIITFHEDHKINALIVDKHIVGIIRIKYHRKFLHSVLSTTNLDKKSVFDVQVHLCVIGSHGQ